MTVDVVYRTCQYAINKNQQGYLTPDQFNLIINQGQLALLDYLLGEVEQYQPGRPQPRVALGMSRAVRSSLTPFIDPLVTLTIDNTGLAVFPSYYQVVDAMYTTSLKRVRYVQQNSLDSNINSSITPVASNPIYLINSAGFQFYPITLGTAKLSYVKTPVTIVWGFNNNPNGDPIYNPATSTDPAWYDVDCLEVIVRALQLIGLNLQSVQVQQYANVIKNQGQ